MTISTSPKWRPIFLKTRFPLFSASVGGAHAAASFAPWHSEDEAIARAHALEWRLSA